VQNPAIEKDERLHLLDEALRGNVHLYVLNFVKLLCEKSALDALDGCAQAYLNRLYDARGILPAQAISAVPLTQEQKDALTRKLEHATNKIVLLENKVDPTLLGGVVVRYEGMELDGSVTGRLAAVRRMLLS
jgi:F-type H+-transporting ATPase subunit delta